MSLESKHIRSIKTLLRLVNNMASDGNASWVFRGHSTREHRLKTSLERYWSIVHEEWDQTVDHMLEQFRDGLIRTGISRPPTCDRFTWMELARHHGVPTPLLDFSWSPYVALFFAFNRVHYQPGKKSGSSVLYALNVNQLAKHWARENASDPDGPQFPKYYRDFCNPSTELFKTCLPENSLRFLPAAGEYSPRMQRQMGAFIYCTLDYTNRNVEDLEGYLASLPDGFDSPMLPNSKEATIIKIFLPHSMSTDIFKHLELINITGASLFGDADGVADDIWNAYHYNRRLYLRNDGRIGS